MLQVIFQDESLIVFEKPPGLVVDKSETQTQTTLEDILRSEYKINLNRGGVVHRLDKDTSGLIVVAKDESSLEGLQGQFKSREVKKRYLALVHGFLMVNRLVEGYVMRNPENREKFILVDQISDGGGKESQTEFRPLEQRILSPQSCTELFPDFNKIQLKKLDRMEYGKFTLVECYPLTGRTHQIRVHLKHIGFPIVGDEKYGGRKTIRLDHRWCQRQFLHAVYLAFKHPQTGEQMEFNSSLPEDLAQVWNQLTVYSFN